MPSFDHDSLLELFRNAAGSAAGLLRELNVQLPEYDGVCTASDNLSDLRPAEYRADLVLFLQRGVEKVMGVIVEVQLTPDKNKPYTWPAYVANLRARHRCPVCLLVITMESAVERWAARTIEIGPGSRCVPWVLGPSNVPVVTDLQRAEANVELAVLSAIEHSRNPNVELAAKVTSAAIVASATLDAERSSLYFDILMHNLQEGARSAASKSMNRFGYEYKSDFARHYMAEGRAEGRMEVLLKQLASRFGPLTKSAQSRVRAASEAQLADLAERVLTVQTVDEALSSLP